MLVMFPFQVAHLCFLSVIHVKICYLINCFLFLFFCKAARHFCKILYARTTRLCPGLRSLRQCSAPSVLRLRLRIHQLCLHRSAPRCRQPYHLHLGSSLPRLCRVVSTGMLWVCAMCQTPSKLPGHHRHPPITIPSPHPAIIPALLPLTIPTPSPRPPPKAPPSLPILLFELYHLHIQSLQTHIYSLLHFVFQ